MRGHDQYHGRRQRGKRRAGRDGHKLRHEDREHPNGTVASAKEWLAARARQSDPTNPFCLIVSLLNPHDIFASPAGYTSAGYLPIASGSNKGKLPWQIAPFTDITALPDSYDLSASQLANKPSMQATYRWTAAQSASEEAARRAAAIDYLRFYAYLIELTEVSSDCSGIGGSVWC